MSARRTSEGRRTSEPEAGDEGAGLTPSEGGGPSPTRTWWIAALSFFLLGGTYALATPLTGGPDEAAHAIRAAAVVRGQLSSSFRTVDVPGGFTKPITDLTVPRAYAELPDTLVCLGFTSARPASCGAPIRSHGPDVRAETYVGAYPLTYYALVGWPTRLVGARLGLYLARLVAVALCAALLASAVRALTEHAALRGAQRTWATAGVVASATPVAMFLAGTINPSGLEIAAAVCLWAALLVLLDEPAAPGWRPAARVAVAGILLAATRPLSPMWTVAILALALAAAARRHAPFWREARARVAVGAVALVAVAMQVVAMVTGSTTAVITSPPGASEGRLWYAWEATRRSHQWLDQLVGDLGWRDVPLWPFVTPLWGAAVVALVVVAWRRADRRQRWTIVATFAALLVVPIAAEVASGRTVGLAWQGRYALPLAVGLPLQAAWVLARTPVAERERRREIRWAGGLVALLAACQGAAILRLLDRYADGLPSAVLAALRVDGGVGLLGWRALVALSAVITVIVGAGWVWLATLAAPSPPAVAGE
jgi:hypothetical protein